MWCRKEVVKISLQRVLKVVLVKLPRASKGEEREKEKLLRIEEGYLGKYSSREKCKRREREMGLVVDQDQGLTVTPPRPVALDRNRGEIILENSNSIQCRFFRSYLSLSAHDKSQGPVIALS